MNGKKHFGFGLIEMLVTISLIAIVASIAVPSFNDFIANSQIRTVAESVRNGLQLARTEAVKRNAMVSYTLNNNTSWVVGCTTVTANCPATIQSKPAKESAAGNISVTKTGGNSVRFTSLGTTDPGGAGQMTRVDIDSSSLAAAISKNLRINIGAGGSVRLCDPNILVTTDPRFC